MLHKLKYISKDSTIQQMITMAVEVLINIKWKTTQHFLVNTSYLIR
jgi:hypothetical protein